VEQLERGGLGLQDHLVAGLEVQVAVGEGRLFASALVGEEEDFLLLAYFAKFLADQLALGGDR
jgi:hypothetical protein